MAQPLPSNVPSPETRLLEKTRLVWERARLDEAGADVIAGRVISGPAAIDWLDRWAAGEDLEDPSLS